MLPLFRTYCLHFSKHITAIGDAYRKVVLRVWFQTQQHQPASFDQLFEMQVLRPPPQPQPSRSETLGDGSQASASQRVLWVILMRAKVWEPLLEDERIGVHEVSSALQA